MAKIKIDAYKCERCKHIWAPRNNEEEPRVCPKCKSPYWNKQKKLFKNKIFANHNEK